MTHSAMLDELERDVERARARLAEDIARLRSPTVLSHARADLIDRATDYKDQLVERVSDAVSERTQSFTQALRRQAQENPAAVAVIGAGLAWRLWKKPPITTLLLGAGLASLLAGRGEAGRANVAADSLTQQARDFSDQASVVFADVADRTSKAIAEFSEHQREAVRDNPVAMGFAAMAVGAALALALSRRD